MTNTTQDYELGKQILELLLEQHKHCPPTCGHNLDQRIDAVREHGWLVKNLTALINKKVVEELEKLKTGGRVKGIMWIDKRITELKEKL